MVAALRHAHQGWAFDAPPELAAHMARTLLEMFHILVRPEPLSSMLAGGTPPSPAGHLASAPGAEA